MNKNLVKTITGVMAATTIISAMAITSNADVATPVVSHAAITQAAAPQVRVAPTPVSGLIDTGTWYNLVYPGQALNGKMVYSLDNCNWSEAIPVAMEAGTYKVYFKVVSNDGAQETEVNFVQITIANPGPRDFVNLMFVKLLNRNADVNSLNNLAHGITFDNKTGADIVYGIISSSEFRNLNLSNEDYVERLYQALAGRSSDPAGKANWVNLLKNGATREEVVVQQLLQEQSRHLLL